MYELKHTTLNSLLNNGIESLHSAFSCCWTSTKCSIPSLSDTCYPKQKHHLLCNAQRYKGIVVNNDSLNKWLRIWLCSFFHLFLCRPGVRGGEEWVCVAPRCTGSFHQWSRTFGTRGYHLLYVFLGLPRYGKLYLNMPLNNPTHCPVFPISEVLQAAIKLKPGLTLIAEINCEISRSKA